MFDRIGEKNHYGNENLVRGFSCSIPKTDGGKTPEVVGLENPPRAAQGAAQEDLGNGTASGHRRNGDGFYGFGASAARRFRTASAVWRRREEAEGSAETAAAVSARVERLKG